MIFEINEAVSIMTSSTFPKVICYSLPPAVPLLDDVIVGPTTAAAADVCCSAGCAVSAAVPAAGGA